MRIGFIGSRGFIGTHLLKYLCSRLDWPVRVMVRGPGDRIVPAVPGVEVFQGDLLSVEDCKKFLEDVQVIYYLAHYNRPTNSDHDLPNDALLNSIPLLNLIQAATGRNARPHLIYFSSGGAVYGRSPNRIPFRETDACEPCSSYGIQKLAAESYLRLAAKNGTLTATVLRPGNAYGALSPHEKLNGLIGITLHNIFHSKPAVVFGDPGNVRDYIHLDDICRISEKVIQPFEDFSIFNVGCQKGYSVVEVLDILENIFHLPFRRDDLSKIETGTNLPNWCVLDISKAKAELDWSPQVDLVSGIQRMILDALSEYRSSVAGGLLKKLDFSLAAVMDPALNESYDSFKTSFTNN